MTDEPNAQQEETKIEVSTPMVEDVIDGGAQITTPPTEPGGHVEPQEPPKAPAYDDGRAALAEKFKRTRVDKEPPVAATGDFSDPAQTYGQVAVPEPAAVETPPAEPAAPAPVAPVEPTKFKLKVRGQERELTQDEVIAAAQKALAGDSYLEDARNVLETTKRVNVSRQHPDDIDPATAPEPDPNADDPTNVDPLEEAIEQIQFGDPKEAKAKLGATIAEAAAKAVQQATVTDRVRQDIVNDLRAHDDFVKQHSDLSSDPIATSVIRDGLLNGYREDLLKIGVPAEKIPTDPTQLANHHRHYKLQGQPVRQVAMLLDAAHRRFVDWRGGTSRQEQPQPPTPQNRVDINLNRDERRMAIPQQPTRASVQPSMTQQPAAPRSRRDAVLAAQRARGQAG